MANKFVIEVRAKGFSNLENQFNKANVAMGKYDKQAGKIRGTTSGLRRAIGALRNNVLLMTFAFAGAVKGMGALVGTSAKFESLRTRLVGLTGSVQGAEKAFANFNSVAATTPFTLEDVVGAGAQLQAFGADANALIKPVTDLAAFMGSTATEAANALGRAFAGGAGAADILRERGILNLIKTSQGLDDLSKTTLPQFREALIKSLQDPTVGIAGSTDRMSKTFEGASSNMRDSLTRLMAASGKAASKFLDLEDNMIKIGGAVERISKQIDFMADPVQNLASRLKELGLQADSLVEIQTALESKDTRDAIAEEDALIVKLAQDLRHLGGMGDLFSRDLAGVSDFLTFDRKSTFQFTGDLEMLGEQALKLRQQLQDSLNNETTAQGLNTLVTNLERVQRLIQLLQLETKETGEVVPEMLPDETFFDPFESFLKDLKDEQQDAVDAYVAGVQAQIDANNELQDVQVDNHGF